ncbi:hypothetical protein WJX84_005462 [Apatococcus fuscideae]|uniref:Uncharacterized protein n=1 Tax=Apatococcus fuscideae TaxID=2026836 RepID=A0AAW1T3C8_9CHLO
MPWEWVDRRDRPTCLHDEEAQNNDPSQLLLPDGKRRFRPAGSPAGAVILMKESAFSATSSQDAASWLARY